MRYRFSFILLQLLFWSLKGLAFSIEFTGGLVMEVNYPQAAPIQQIRTDLGKSHGRERFGLLTLVQPRDVQIRLPLKGDKTSAEMSAEVMEVIHQHDAKAELRRTEFVGPQVGEELATDGLTALLLVIIGIMVVYLAFRFEWKFAGSHYR